MLRLIKNRLFYSLIVVSALICSAHGDYFLYWTAVDFANNKLSADEVKAAELYAYDSDNNTPKLVATMTADMVDQDYLALLKEVDSSATWLDFSVNSNLKDVSYILSSDSESNSGSESKYGFYVDLYGDDGTLLFDGLQYNLTSVSALSDYISTNINPSEDQQYWQVKLSSVPEPSSGLMILMGLSFLALRRRLDRGDSHERKGGCL